MSLEVLVDNNIKKFSQNPIVEKTGYPVHCFGMVLAIESWLVRELGQLSEHVGDFFLASYIFGASFALKKAGDFASEKGIMYTNKIAKYAPEITTLALTTYALATELIPGMLGTADVRDIPAVVLAAYGGYACAREHIPLKA